MMSEPPFDRAAYARLLTEYLPAVVDTLEEHERLLEAAESLMEKGEALTPEERKLLELLVLLIRHFEREVEEAEQADEQAEADEPAHLPPPHETLRRLMEARGLQPSDLCDFLGNPANVAAVLQGRKPLTRGQAKQLARYFQVPIKLFLAD
jgi:antitoxin component HigA of HigAB toxin-antitoxin module